MSMKTMIAAACLGVVFGRAHAQEHAAWFDGERPFVASQEAQSLIHDIGKANPEIEATLAPFLEAATQEYRQILADFALRLDQGGGTPQDRYTALLPDWETALLRLEGSYEARIVPVLDDRMKGEWKFQEDRHAYRQAVKVLAGLISPTDSHPDLFQLLDDAEVVIPPAGKAREAIAVQAAYLSGLARSFKAEWPAMRAISAKPNASGDDLDRIRRWREATLLRIQTATYEAASAIGSLLNEPERLRFQNVVLCKRCPELCITTPGQIAFELLKACDSIDAETRSHIDVIEKEYSTQLGTLRATFAGFQDLWDSPAVAAAWKHEFETLQAQGHDPQEAWNKHPGLPTMRQLCALEADTARQIRSLFAADQWERLPVSVQLALAWP